MKDERLADLREWVGDAGTPFTTSEEDQGVRSDLLSVLEAHAALKEEVERLKTMKWSDIQASVRELADVFLARAETSEARVKALEAEIEQLRK